MKIMFIIIMMLLLSGCSDDNKQKTNQVNINELDNEIQYNVFQTNWAYMKNLIQVEDGMIFIIDHDDNDTRVQGQYLMYYENGESTIINNDINNGCDFDNVEKCTSYFNGFKENYFYFDKDIYYVEERHLNNNENDNYVLCKSEIDGTNRQDVVQFEIPKQASRIAGFSIHKGKLYATYDNNLVIYNLITNDIKIIEFGSASFVKKIYLYNDIAYVEIAQYLNNDGERIKDAIIKLDLITFELEVMYENVPLYFIDETNLISFDENEEEVNTYLQNHETGEKVILTDGYVTYRLKENGKYVLGHYDKENDMSSITVFDEQGNLLKETKFEDNHTAMGVIDGKYYMTKENFNKKNTYYYLDLNSESDELVKLNFK